MLLLAMLSLAGPCAYASSPKWETQKTDRAEAEIIAKDGDITIKATKGSIIVTSNRQVQVKIFSILGQLLTQETLPAGTSQLTLNTHGVFIVKTGSLTCKVAL